MQHMHNMRRKEETLIFVGVVAFLIFLWNWFRRQKPEQPTQNPEPEIIHNYLTPHTVGLFVEHDALISTAQNTQPSDNPSQTISEAILSDAATQIALQLSENSLLRSDDLLRDFFIPPERIITFPNFSLALVEAPHAETQDEIAGLINRLNTQLDRSNDRRIPRYTSRSNKDQSSQQTLAAEHKNTDFAARAAEEDTSAPRVENLVIRQAVANWLSNGAANNGPGSPAARPIPVEDQSYCNRTMLELIQDYIPNDLLKDIQSITDPTNVHVFVLDTLPDDIDLTQAYKRWGESPVGSSSPYPSSTIINELLLPGGPLARRHYAGWAHILQQANFTIPSHDYVMTDHGVFVAAIIHALAPHATIHMVEVLNPFGVGSLESIGRGFALAAQYVTPSTPVVVNASLALDLPSTKEEWWLKEVLAQYPFWNQLSFEQLKLAAQPLNRICALFRTSESDPEFSYTGIIAAAGNDYKHSMQKRPPARFPAAFDGVIGVGALNHDKHTATSYTNKADTNLYEAISAFGGEAQGSNTHNSRGFVGPYIGTFPNGKSNITGLARWSGTSFAAPIISGLIAALMSKKGTNFATAEQQVMQAFTKMRNNQPEPTSIS